MGCNKDGKENIMSSGQIGRLLNQFINSLVGVRLRSFVQFIDKGFFLVGDCIECQSTLNIEQISSKLFDPQMFQLGLLFEFNDKRANFPMVELSQDRIIKNNQVYIGQPAGHSYQAIKNSLPLVVDQLGKVIASRLIEGKITSFKDFFTFYVETEEKTGIKRPSVHINGSLKILTQFKQSNVSLSIKENKEVFVDIASALLHEPTFVQSLIEIYIKAINDLISNGNELSLDLHICRIKLSKKQSSCQFRTFFAGELNQKTIEPKTKRILLHTCPNSECHQPKQNITTTSSQLYQTKWTQIKKGNLYNRPSLLQIKQLYDKGRELQLKYHRLFI